MNSKTLEVFTDFVCPWCYLGENKLLSAIPDNNLTVQYIYFPLHPDTPVEGMTLEQLFAGRGLDVARDQEKLGTIMRGEGLCYGSRTHTYNSSRAQILAKYIESRDNNEGAEHVSQFRAGVFAAYFSRGENIAEFEVLQGICHRIGLVDMRIEQALADSAAVDAVASDWSYCRKLAVTGVPAFRFGEKWVHGFAGVSALADLIRVEPTG
ncbi:MAG: hypothetical protein HOB73_02935 [Planctomycetaceae bacterium]|jgi:predicted DsbA family dithiol-disulfide isomerase|nr:hypothetical protein [Planctomycetaceae bacterium]MBT7254994.1 hypothetical protein [Planctomycetaceae bacterium]